MIRNFLWRSHNTIDLDKTCIKKILIELDLISDNLQCNMMKYVLPCVLGKTRPSVHFHALHTPWLVLHSKKECIHNTCARYCAMIVQNWKQKVSPLTPCGELILINIISDSIMRPYSIWCHKTLVQNGLGTQ